MFLKQELIQVQKQTLSLRQTQSLQILSMNNIDLTSYLEEQQTENPILDFHRTHHSYEEMTAVGAYFRDNTTDLTFREYDSEEEPRREKGQIDNYKPLRAHILGQLDPRADNNRPLLEFLIDSLDRRGYLPLSAAQIAAYFGCTEETAAAAIALLQTLEPAGIGAADLTQCLLLQAERDNAPQAVRDIIRNHLGDVASSRLQNIARETGLPIRTVKESVQFIKTLNPLPINGLPTEEPTYVVPDVIFRLTETDCSAEINDRWIGSIGVSRLYMNLSREVEDPTAQEYLLKKIDHANFIVRCVEQRRDTLLRVSEFILRYQLDFFRCGTPLRPLTLRQIAEAVSLHESTVSRAIKDKYVSTPRGTFPLKACLTGCLAAEETGRAVSRDEAKQVLKQLISEEDKTNPLSDSELAEKLEEAGVPISRRTVAKYRDELGLPGAFARKY